jgi:hypothetical protein
MADPDDMTSWKVVLSTFVSKGGNPNSTSGGTEMSLLKRLRLEEEGQGLVDYTLFVIRDGFNQGNCSAARMS